MDRPTKLEADMKEEKVLGEKASDSITLNTFIPVYIFIMLQSNH
jgi:hypothetical protein